MKLLGGQHFTQTNTQVHTDKQTHTHTQTDTHTHKQTRPGIKYHNTKFPRLKIDED